MKKTFLLFTILIFIVKVNVLAQIADPVHWSYGAKRTGKHEAVIFLKATIDDGWHIYSNNQKDGGPVKTSFGFEQSKDYELIGTIREPDPIVKYEKVFDMDVCYFEKMVIFQQKIKLKTARTSIKSTVNFMVCNAHECLPPENVNIIISIK